MPSHESTHYLITHRMWHDNYDVSGRQVYHVDNSVFWPGKPDLTFHAGSDTSAPVAAICKFKHFSSDTEIGLRDSKQPDGMSWERLNRRGFFKVEHSFDLDVGDPQARTFTWKSTSWMTDSLKLMDERTQQVVAVFLSASIFSRKSGQLDIHVDYGNRFQLMVLITGLAVHESSRRRTMTGAGGGGGC